MRSGARHSSGAGPAPEEPASRRQHKTHGSRQADGRLDTGVGGDAGLWERAPCGHLRADSRSGQVSHVEAPGEHGGEALRLKQMGTFSCRTLCALQRHTHAGSRSMRLGASLAVQW